MRLCLGTTIVSFLLRTRRHVFGLPRLTRCTGACATASGSGAAVERLGTERRGGRCSSPSGAFTPYTHQLVWLGRRVWYATAGTSWHCCDAGHDNTRRCARPKGRRRRRQLRSACPGCEFRHRCAKWWFAQGRPCSGVWNWRTPYHRLHGPRERHHAAFQSSQPTTCGGAELPLSGTVGKRGDEWRVPIPATRWPLGIRVRRHTVRVQPACDGPRWSHASICHVCGSHTPRSWQSRQAHRRSPALVASTSSRARRCDTRYCVATELQWESHRDIFICATNYGRARCQRAGFGDTHGTTRRAQLSHPSILFVYCGGWQAQAPVIPRQVTTRPGPHREFGAA